MKRVAPFGGKQLVHVGSRKPKVGHKLGQSPHDRQLLSAMQPLVCHWEPSKTHENTAVSLRMATSYGRDAELRSRRLWVRIPRGTVFQVLAVPHFPNLLSSPADLERSALGPSGSVLGQSGRTKRAAPAGQPAASKPWRHSPPELTGNSVWWSGCRRGRQAAAPHGWAIAWPSGQPSLTACPASC